MSVAEAQLERTTVELLSRDWEEIYGVLDFMNDAVKSSPEATHQLLKNCPPFARAIFQAQLELGIANLEEENIEDHRDEQLDQTLQKVIQITAEEFANLPEEVKQDIMNIRQRFKLPPQPDK
ncbi:hypothetical protein TRFO_04275 [Tritrichomonas foetus]|uniref:Cleavage stimulation factor subunit 2 hinge domain-containing protein n=1 Tax=Tritrichomonas foetus TaxID=1144522 RepID=A0A1J4KK93_9EUKA|nr:hypothetical protein TRFO_04275 [Tritrichomonas foetus]|eukprot:OHT10260.1 hypothetical protein TRFO_04275 [Tritrichomonas foetus]